MNTTLLTPDLQPPSAIPAGLSAPMATPSATRSGAWNAPATLVNFRDVGGMRASMGRSVRLNKLYRSASPGYLNDEDTAIVGQLGLSTIVDLRTEGERIVDGVAPDALGAHVLHVPFIGQLWDVGVFADQVDAATFLGDRYIDMLEVGGAALAEVISAIAYRPGPVLVHCMAGKDRTGLVVAAVLAMLGVDETQIVEDYEKTASSMPALGALIALRRPSAAIEFASLPSMFREAPGEAMRLALGHVRSVSGSMERFLIERGLGVHAATVLRNNLLTS
jgi:protein-tyrosine phosphatase